MRNAIPLHDFVDVPGNPRPDGAELVWFTGSAGRTLRACMVPALPMKAARGTVIVCPGRTEFVEKYFEVARELQAKGFAVLILDWPGQGLSERLLDDPKKGHIDNFQTFMGALRNGLDELEERLPRPYLCLAHSMGGAIALAAISERLVNVEAAAFSAPMWGLRTRIFGIRYLVWAMRVMGRSGDYAQQPGPPERFKDNIVTHDERRWQIARDLVDTAPDLDLGPITWGWLGASLDIVRTFARRARLAEIDIPLLVATAEEEKLIDNRSHDRVCGLLPDCEHIQVPGAMHEILMETDERRAIWWAAFDRLLERAGI
ncbi:MAG: alpha/beta hydrolase [Hyphomonadaceae bacterium]|nr:alpha/beta hydrolase [Hyphomonadaceae bacterium]